MEFTFGLNGLASGKILKWNIVINSLFYII